ncbi:hypothetical protein ACS0TY_019208 [Phlomoides rotata]
MDNCSSQKHPKAQNSCTYGGNISEQEEDIVCRMHKLVGDKWELIAGRIPGRTAKEIERFWLMRNGKESNFKSKS